MAGGCSTGKSALHTRLSVIAVVLGFAAGLLFSYGYTTLHIRPLVRALGSEDRHVAAAAAAKLAGNTSHSATRRIVLEYENIRREAWCLTEDTAGREGPDRRGYAYPNMDMRNAPERAHELYKAAKRISARLPFVFHEAGRPAASALAGFLYKHRLYREASAPFWRRIISQWQGKEARAAKYEVDAFDPAVRLVRRCLPFTGDAAIAPLKRFIRKGPPGAAKLAIEILRDIATPAAVEALLPMAVGKDPSTTNSRACDALVCISPEDALQLLNSPAGRTSAPLRMALLECLARRRQEGILEAAVSALGDGDPLVRRSAAYALGCLGNRKALEPLTAALAGHDRAIRHTAATALGALGDPRAVEPLIDALKDDHYSVRNAAAAALAAIGDPRAIEPLAEARHYVALGLLGDLRAVVPLLSRARPRRPHYISRDFYKALGELRDRRATKRLVEACFYTEYHSSDVYIALKKIGDPDAVTMLGAALFSRDAERRWSAAWVLGKLGGPRATEYLARAIHDREIYVRRTVVRALGGAQEPAAVEALTRAIADENPDVRREAAASLGAFDDETGRRALLSALADDADPVRLAAAISLANLGDPRAQATLIQSSRIDPPSRDLLMALERLGTPEAHSATDAALADFHWGSAPPAISLLIRKKGLDGFAREYRRHLHPTANGRAAWLLLLALERSGDIRIARDLLTYGRSVYFEDDIREWAERHGRIGELEDLLEE